MEFKKISWFEIALEINKTRSYYIKGIKPGIEHYYGPYKLHDSNRKEMKNVKGNVFMHMAEDFYIVEINKKEKNNGWRKNSKGFYFRN